MKKFFMMAVCVMALSVGFTACSKDDDDPIVGDLTGKDEKEEVHVPEEALAGKMLRTCPITFASYNELSRWDGQLYFASSVKDANYKNVDWVHVYLKIADNPGYNKWSGRYIITEAEATVIGADNKLKDYVATVYDAKNTNHGWISFEYLGEKTQYDEKRFKVTVHIEEMKGSNGDYARDVNFTVTDWI